MSKEDLVTPSLKNEFLTFSKDFLDGYIDSVDMSPFEVQPVEVAFDRIKRGKKTAEFIRSQISDYQRYNKGLMTKKQEKVYTSHGLFNKFESNVKMIPDEDGMLKAHVRPRGIMTMAPLMSMETVQMVDIISCWNDGKFADFQVKHMTNEMMIQIVEDMQDREHMVTDYSAFEMSIRGWVRELEFYVLKKLAAKAGASFLLAAIERWGIEKDRELVTRFFTANIISRCSGDYVTSFGNGISGVCLMGFCHHKRGIETPFVMTAEGDDAIIQQEVPDTKLLNDLGFDFSVAISGTQSGDTDFLQNRFMDGKRFISVGRAQSVWWVRKGAELKRSKQLYLLRIKALSLWYASPGHPIIWAMVKRIELETRGMMFFKGARTFMDNWKPIDYTGNFPHISVDESMRGPVARGAIGFPPISVPAQKYLESVFLNAKIMQIYNILDDYEDVKKFKLCAQPSRINTDCSAMSELYRILGTSLIETDLSRYTESGVLRTGGSQSCALKTIPECNFW